MRVEFVSPYDHSPNTGIGRYIHALAKHLSRSIDVKIRQPRFLPLAGRFSSLRNLPIGIESHVEGSIVHFPQIMGCAMMLYRQYHPSVATVHDLGFLEFPEEWEMFDPIARQMLRLSLTGLKRVDQIVTDSEFARQGVIRHLRVPPEQVVTVHAGIDHDLFRPIPNARQALIDRFPGLAPIACSPWLLYVGSELPRKNMIGLLKAVASVRARNPAIQLLKVGAAGGAQFRQETTRVIEELGLQPHVHFFEDVAEVELPLFYSAADVFVTASKLEGFGFPVLEAMSCGTPVVCSDAGSLPEIARTEAFYVSPDDPLAFCEQISHLLAQPQSDFSLTRERVTHSNNFDWSETASKLVSVYASLLVLDSTYAA